MRANFLLKLIEYYNEENNYLFEKTVLELSEEERKKGNIQLASKINSALNSKINNGNGNQKETIFSQSSGLKMYEPTNIYTPKDKNTNNNLVDWYYPEDIEQNSLIFNQSIKEQLDNIVKEYSNRDILSDLGLDFENRLLLCGPPGCGKTSTAFLLSKLLNLPLAYVRLDSLISSLLGQTGSNIRKIFDSVNKKNVILFLDEFDAIAKKRDDNHELGELKRVVNTLLQNIDLLSDEVFVIAATNHQDLLDKAVWRRFKTSIYFKLPDFHMRSQYIEKELAKYSYINKIDIHKIANLTKDFNFSQLHDVLIKAIKTAVFHEKKQIITTNHFMKIIKQYTFLFNDANLESTTLNELKNKGYTLREINELTGIPKSTISDRLKEIDKIEQ